MSLGFVETTANLISFIVGVKSINSSNRLLKPMLGLGALICDPIMSPCTITLPANKPRTSPCTRMLFSIGAKTTFLASVALVFLIVTSPPMVAPEFLRTNPSILITPSPISVCEGRAIAAVLFSPTISIRSLSLQV
jgi:hypothetical protein